MREQLKTRMKLSKSCAPNCRRTSLVTVVTVTCLVNRENSNFLLVTQRSSPHSSPHSFPFVCRYRRWSNHITVIIWNRTNQITAKKSFPRHQVGIWNTDQSEFVCLTDIKNWPIRMCCSHGLGEQLWQQSQTDHIYKFIFAAICCFHSIVTNKHSVLWEVNFL